MKRLAWFQFQDHQRCKKPWQVLLVDEMPERHKGAGGLCVFRAREVLILCTLAPKRIMELIGHEIGHAACGHRRTETALERAAEEQIVQWLEPSLMPIMASLGAQIPPLPEGFDAFRKAAMTKR